jgi:hypothetical protein
MMYRYSLGSVARLYLDLVSAGSGVISQSPTVAIQRVKDGKWLQASDGSWQVTIVDNPMTATSTPFLPGRYQFDFDQSLDALTASTDYIAKFVNAGVPLHLEYRDLLFGPVTAAARPALCAVTGTVLSTQGEPVGNVAVKATLVPLLNLGAGRAVDHTKIAVAYTNLQGDFELPLVRGGTFRLEIDAIGYDRKVTVPDQPSALFINL